MSIRRGPSLLTWILVVGLTCGAQAEPVSRVAEGAEAMVVSRHPLASRVGVEVLRAGGNAVDAAVAVSAALAVVLPQAGNVGGGGFMLVYRARDSLATVIDFRETAPAGAHRDLFLNESGDVDTLRARIGHQSVGVPGTVAGLYLAWSKYGGRPWRRLLEPALRFAAAGFVVNEELARGIEKSRRKLQQFPATAELFVPDGEPLAAGDTLVQPELARTLRLLASSGPLAFYEGEIAEALVGEMERGGGLITRDDLLSYRAVERRPLRGRYRDVEILCAPPPSSGGVTLLQMLALLERFELKTDEPSSPTNVHLTVEVMARAFSDRNTFLGDPGFVRVPVQGLLSPAYIETRRRSISVDRATPSRFVSAGEVWRFEPGALPAPGRGARPGRDSESQHAPEPEAPAPGSEAPEDSTGSAQRAGVLRESDNTTHFSIVDPEGNAVALTTTLNSGFGSGVLVQGAGFLLNNEMDDFDARPGHPNQFGLVGGGSNAVAPGKRMLSSMSPTLVLRDGDPWLVLGARGGPRIITAILQILLNVCEFDMDLAEAVAAKRYHHQWLPDVIRYEEGAIQGDTYESLKRMGHELRVLGPSKSSAQCIEITPEGIRRGVSDPRTQGGAAGY